MSTHLTPDTRDSLAALGSIGAGLTRPECVLTTRTGHIYTSDWRGGVAHIRPDGSQTLLLVSDNNFTNKQITQLLLFKFKQA